MRGAVVSLLGACFGAVLVFFHVGFEARAEGIATDLTCEFEGGLVCGGHLPRRAPVSR